MFIYRTYMKMRSLKSNINSSDQDLAVWNCYAPFKEANFTHAWNFSFENHVRNSPNWDSK